MSDNALNATVLLEAISNGDNKAKKQLFALLYDELHSLSSKAIMNERPGHILQTTALIHEAYLKLVDDKQVKWRNQTHFYHIAAQVMRRILVSHARQRDAAKRGGGKRSLSLSQESVQEPVADHMMNSFSDIELLDKILTKLSRKNDTQRMCKIVELLFFAGLTQKQVADMLDISIITVRRDWEFAKVWLYQEMSRHKTR